jgi:hypothetical protein
VSVDEKIFQYPPWGIGKDLGFEDIGICLQDMHAICAHPFLLSPVVGHIPLLTRNNLDLSISSLYQSSPPLSFVFTRLRGQPSQLSLTWPKGFHLDPFFLAWLEEGELDVGDLHVGGGTSSRVEK